MADVLELQQKKKIADIAEAEKECAVIDGELASLKAAYEQYFLGLERHPPKEKHHTLKRRLVNLKESFIRQTALKFRVGSLYQKLLTYERLWARTLQEMENGTYRRDVFKARRKAEQHKPGAAAQAPPRPASDDFDVDEDTAPMPAPFPRDPAAHRPPPPRPQPDSAVLSDEKVRAIYNAYVSAKKRCNEDVSKLTLDAVAVNLRKQVPALLKQHNAKAIEFKIVIKDGKAILKALPKT
jgi:hypothetical protein